MKFRWFFHIFEVAYFITAFLAFQLMTIFVLVEIINDSNSEEHGK